MSITTPAVYVGTYHKYNNGSIFGKWFDLTDFDDEESFQAVCRELHKDESDPEFMLQDWEGIPSRFASECGVDWDFVNSFNQAVGENQAAAFIAWCDYTGECDFEIFQDAYRGEAESEEDYAYDFIEENGIFSDLPKFLMNYFDYAAFARDLFSSDYFFHDGYVFSH